MLVVSLIKVIKPFFGTALPMLPTMLASSSLVLIDYYWLLRVIIISLYVLATVLRVRCSTGRWMIHPIHVTLVVARGY